MKKPLSPNCKTLKHFLALAPTSENVNALLDTFGFRAYTASSTRRRDIDDGRYSSNYYYAYDGTHEFYIVPTLHLAMARGRAYNGGGYKTNMPVVLSCRWCEVLNIKLNDELQLSQLDMVAKAYHTTTAELSKSYLQDLYAIADENYQEED